MVVKDREWWNKQNTWRRIKRTVPKEVIPAVWEAMKHDGVWIQLTSDGYNLFVGSYKITKASLSESWNINPNAVDRIIHYAFNKNDFGVDYGWDEP